MDQDQKDDSEVSEVKRKGGKRGVVDLPETD